MPFPLPQGRIVVMGVLNVTPDSFSDGGLFVEPHLAIEHGMRMVEEGADLVDVGGESTRPGAEVVTVEEELRRTVSVVAGLASRGVAVSIDTSKAEVAKACLEVGAVVVNDVTALSNPAMSAVCADAGCTVCLMHMQGDPRTMQAAPSYTDVVSEVRDFLVSRAVQAKAAGIADVWIDPGIGFGKTVQHNLALLAHLEKLVESGFPVLVGVSRKSFIGRVLADGDSPLPSDQRLEGSLAAQVLAQAKGARIVRTHDVVETRRAAALAAAVLSQG